MRNFLHIILCISMLILLSVPVNANDSLDQPDQMETASEETVVEPETQPHVHNYDILKSDTATCGAPGTATYACSCGEEIQQSSGATGRHSFGAVEYIDGNWHGAVCTGCGKEEKSDHSWDSGRMITEPDCTREGEQIFTCSGCRATYSRNLARTAHDYDPNLSSDSIHVCSVCGSSESHFWDAGEVSRRPTCKETGTFVRYCAICEMTLAETLEKLTVHTYDSACDPDCNVCGTKREIEHTFSTLWSNNYKGHWHECTKCGEQQDFSKHDAGPEATEKEDQICRVCKYIIEPKKNHVHKYEKQRSYDEVGHWFECTGCGNEKEYASHRFENDCDQECDICGYERENAHAFGDNWQMSNFEHWQVCTICKAESRREKHIPGDEASETAAQICTVCRFELVPRQEHVHDFGTAWTSTEDTHWQICSCGETSVPASHVWDSGKENKNGSITYTCIQCSMEKIVETPSSGVSGMIVVITLLALVCVGGIAALVIIMKSGRFDFIRRDEADSTNYE